MNQHHGLPGEMYPARDSEDTMHMPDIGTSERDALEREAVVIGDRALQAHDSLEIALGFVRRHFGYTHGASALAKHVEQVWIGRMFS